MELTPVTSGVMLKAFTYITQSSFRGIFPILFLVPLIIEGYLTSNIYFTLIFLFPFILFVLCNIIAQISAKYLALQYINIAYKEYLSTGVQVKEYKHKIFGTFTLGYLMMSTKIDINCTHPSIVLGLVYKTFPLK